MSRQIKTLPIVERWDCAGCGNCCRGSVIPLNDEDLEKLDGQDWGSHPELGQTSTVIQSGRGANRSRLAQREDGSCVFLMGDNRCRIHVEHGAEAKPLVCRLYPLQAIPHEKHAVLTLRRSCPSAAADRGRSLQEHRDVVTELIRANGMLDRSVQPPALTKRHPAAWTQVRGVTSAIARMASDERYPLVRRLAHGVLFCRLLDECDAPPENRAKLDELISAGEALAYDFAGEEFRDRQPPKKPHAALFRQVASEYLRLHSQYRGVQSWGERWRMTRTAFAIAHGRGSTPRIMSWLPEVTFAELEEPLGPLPAEVQEPLIRFYESNTASLQYTLAARRNWSVSESFQAIALAYPVALWLLRWCSHGRSPTREDAIELVTILDRGQGHEPLIGAQHRRRVQLLNASNTIIQLLAWYAR